MRKPGAFLIDEPLSNLDAQMRVQAGAEIATLHRQLGSTVTHDQAEAMTMSDRIAVMMGGEILQVDTPDQVHQMSQVLRVAEFMGARRSMSSRRSGRMTVSCNLPQARAPAAAHMRRSARRPHGCPSTSNIALRTKRASSRRPFSGSRRRGCGAGNHSSCKR